MKKRAPSNRIGAEGEAVFVRVAARHGLLPTKISEDVGLDFVCEVDEGPKSLRASHVSNVLVGACVRATTSEYARVTLDRADASVLLRADFPIFIALIHLGDGSDGFHYRFVDDSFGSELAEFLDSASKTLSLTPERCRPEADFRRELEEMIRPGMVEQVRLALAERRIGQRVAKVTVEVNRDAHGQRTVVTALNFYEYFQQLSELEQDQLYAATFGSPDHQQDRLRELALHEELLTGLEGLPQPYVLGGSVAAEPVELAVADPANKSSCRFTYTANRDHSGYVHDAGFALTISKRKQRDNVWIHELRAFPDPGVQLDLVQTPDLLSFLELCVPGALIRTPSAELPVESFAGLPQVGWFAGYLRHALKLRGWSPRIASLRDALDPETLDTMAWLAALSQNPLGVAKLAFVLGDSSELEEQEAAWRLPAVANTSQASVIAWLSCEGWRSARGATDCGLRTERVVGVELEVVDRLEKSSTDPEFVVTPDELVIGRSPNGAYYVSSSDGSKWPYELTFD
jgi:hypothetical protein